MGVFGNEDDRVGTRLAPSIETEGNDGFSAFGKPVPFYRRQAGYNHCKQMGLTDKDAIWSVVNGLADRIERDEPLNGMNFAYGFLDVTGIYRLLAVLCTAEKPRIRVPVVTRRILCDHDWKETDTWLIDRCTRCGEERA